MCTEFVPDAPCFQNAEVLEDMLDVRRRSNEPWAELTFLVRKLRTAPVADYESIRRQLDQITIDILAHAARVCELAAHYRASSTADETLPS
jgi:hypothetical protein